MPVLETGFCGFDSHLGYNASVVKQADTTGLSPVASAWGFESLQAHTESKFGRAGNCLLNSLLGNGCGSSPLLSAMKKKVIITEKDWPESIYRTKEWEDSVTIIRWEHDYEKGQYVIDYTEGTPQRRGTGLENRSR